MAVSSTFSGGRQPMRSVSLPSRLETPNSFRIESVLEKLSLFRPSPSSSCSTGAALCAEDIRTGLVGLAELYRCVEEMVHSPLTQQVLLRHQDGKIVQASLRGSVVLLDSCGCARDAMAAMREHVQALQSGLRRKGAHSSSKTLIHSYILCRKRVKKDIAKCIPQLKKMEEQILSPLPEKLGFLREASTLAISVLKSLLVFLSTPVVGKRGSKWDLISQLMVKRSEVKNEMASVDVSVSSIKLGCRESMADQVQMAGRVGKRLHDLEDELERVFRCLLQHRVSFLNILAH